MRRVTVAEIMRETGLSRATVDRVLNGRGRVHPRTQHVIRETIGRLQSPPARPDTAPVADMMLRVGRGMTRQMIALWQARAVSGQVHDVYEAGEADVVGMIGQLGEDVSRPLIITLKNSGRIADALRNARLRGKRIISLVSDVSADARDHYIGIDNRAAGQTAAFLIGRALGARPSLAGVVVGDGAFRCHEDREIGFRTGLRAQFPKVVLAGEARGEDSPELTFRAVTRMLQDHPALGAIYNVGGGNQGLTAALRDAGRTDDVIVVGHDVNFVTAPLLHDRLLDCVLATDPAHLLDTAIALATAPKGSAPDSRLVDFGVYTRFNVPGFAQ
jgi:LacI family transcriptional regulator